MALTIVPAAKAANLSGTWQINSEGQTGELILRQDGNGELSGSIYGEPMHGFHASQTNDVVWVRGPIENPTQAFVGTVETATRISGTYYELAPGGIGARPSNNYRFAAERPIRVPFEPGPRPTPTPSLNTDFGIFSHPGPNSVAGRHTVFNRPSEFGRSQEAELVLNQTVGDDITGSMGDGSSLIGHYAISSGEIVFLRKASQIMLSKGKAPARDSPYQLYFGQVDGSGPLQARGIFYALTTDAGASATGMRFDWATVVPKRGDLTNTWKINRDGLYGNLDLTHAADGILGGFLNGDPVQGFYSPKERIAVILRGALDRPTEAYIGHVSEDGDTMAGTYYALYDTYGKQARPRAHLSPNKFSFAARRGPNAVHPTTLPELPRNAENTPELRSGTFDIFNRPSESKISPPGGLSLTLRELTLDGSVFGEPIYGTYALNPFGLGEATESVAFIRLRNNQPFQLYVVKEFLPPDASLASGMSGDFYALTIEAGASAERIKFDWSADHYSP